MKRYFLFVILCVSTMLFKITKEERDTVIFYENEAVDLYGGCAGNQLDCLGYHTCYCHRYTRTVEYWGCTHTEYPAFCEDGIAMCWIYYTPGMEWKPVYEGCQFISAHQ